jgi:drug/metabolite transporter (DMT)-like permease
VAKPALTIYDLLLFIMALFWGTNYVVIKWAGTEIPNLVFSFLRFIIGTASIGVVLLVSARQTGEALTLPRREWPPVLFLAFISTVVYQALFLSALRYTTAANASLIITSAPVIVVMLNAVRGKDRIGRGGVVGALLAFAGVGLVVLRSHAGETLISSETIRGDLFAIGAALAWVWSVLASNEPIKRNPVMSFSFWHGLWMTVMMGGLALPDFAHTDWSRIDGRMLVLLVYSGIGPFCVAGMIWNFCVRRIGPSRTAIYSNLQPIIAAVTGAIFIGEPLTAILMVGTVMVLTGVALVRRG